MIIGVVLAGIVGHAPAAVFAEPEAPATAASSSVKDAAEGIVRTAQDAVRASPWLWANGAAAVISVAALLLSGVLRPGGLSRGRAVDAHPWFLWIVCALMIWLSFGVAMGAYMGVSGGGGGKGLPAEARAQALTVGFGYVVSLGVAGLLVHLVRASAPSSGFTASRRAAAQGLGGFLAAWPLIVVATSVATWVHTRVTGAEPDMIAHQTLRQLVDHPHDPWAWLLCGLAVVAAPLQEEIIYRGFLQSAVLRILGRPWIAVVLTSLVFAGVHTIGQSAVPWYAAVAIFTLSVCMGAAFERTRSLLAPIIMHMLFNGANVAMVAMGRTG